MLRVSALAFRRGTSFENWDAQELESIPMSLLEVRNV
jgi:hypothetical protein